MSASSKPSKLSRVDRKRPKWLIITSAKGGSGKTTTARNIAVLAAHAGLSVATIDCDMQASLTAWFERRPGEAPTLDHYKVPMGDIVDAMAEIDDRQDLDLIVVDTPPGVESHPQPIRELMRRSDFIIIPSGQGDPDLESVIEWMRFVRREGRRAAFLLNRTKRSAGSLERAKLKLIEEGHLCPFDVRDLEDIQATHGMGLGVLEIRGASGIEDVRGVWAYVRNELELTE
jgi:chromosome partitioning protein